MPVFPGQAQMIDTNVPGPPSNPNAGLVGTSIGGFGQQVAQGAMAIADKLQQAEASDALFAAKNADDSWSAEYKAKLLATSKDGYVRDDSGGLVQNDSPGTDGQYKTVTQAYREAANSRFQAQSEAMPNHIAARAYKDQGSTFFTGEMNTVFGHEQQVRAQNSKDMTQEQVRAVADQFVSTPSVYGQLGSQGGFYDRAQGIVDKINADVKNRIMMPGEAEALQKEALATIAQGNMAGYEQLILNNSIEGKKNPGYFSKDQIDRALDVIDGKDSLSQTRTAHGVFTLSSVLSPIQKERIRHQLIELYKPTGHLDQSNYNAAVNTDARGAAEIAGSSGQLGVVGNILHDYIQKGAPFVESGQTTQDQIVRQAAGAILVPGVNAQLKASSFALQSEAQQRAGTDDFLSNTKMMIHSEIPPQLQSEFSGAVGDGAVADLEKARNAQIDSYSQEYQKDSAAFVIAHAPAPPGKSNSLQVTEEALKKNGISNWTKKDAGAYFEAVSRLQKAKEPDGSAYWRGGGLSKDMSEFIGKEFTGFKAADVDAKAFALQKLYQSMPSKTGDVSWSSVIDQAMKDGKLPPAFEFTKNISDPQLTSEFMKTLQVYDSKTATDEFKKQFDTINEGTTDYKKFTALVVPKISDFVHGLEQSSGGFDPSDASRSNALRDFYVLKAAQIYNNSGQKDANTAANKAAQVLIGNAGTNTKTGVGSWWNPLNQHDRMSINRFIPHVITSSAGSPVVVSDDQKSRMNSYVDYISQNDPGYFAAKNVVPPDNFRGTPDQWQQELMHRTVFLPDSKTGSGYKGYWQSSTTGSPVVLQTKDSKGNRSDLVIPFGEAYDHMYFKPSESDKAGVQGVIPGVSGKQHPPGMDYPNEPNQRPYRKQFETNPDSTYDPEGPLNINRQPQGSRSPSSEYNPDIAIDVNALNSGLKDKGFSNPITYQHVERLWNAASEPEAMAAINKMDLPEDRRASLREYVTMSFQAKRDNANMESQLNEVVKKSQSGSTRPYHVEVKRVRDKSSPTGYSSSIRQVYE